jgi:DNA-binding MarR family transcriptional regulator
MCCAAIDGRRAAKSLSALAKQFELTEPELEILWCLRQANHDGVDQTTLAARLVLSPAQISACVEKLRLRGLILHQDEVGDRRRHLWQLRPQTIELLDKIATAARGNQSHTKRPAQAEAA